MIKATQLHQQYGQHYYIGQWSFKLGNYELASDHFNKFILQSIIKRSHDYHRNGGLGYSYLGQIQFTKRNLQLSLTYFSKSIQMGWNNQLKKGIVLDLMQETDKANKNYQIALTKIGVSSLDLLKQIYKQTHKFNVMQ